jgi:chromate transporter
MSIPAPAPGAAVVPTRIALALTFARIALLGFGGALPWAHRALVERRGWLSTAEFSDVLALCQLLPGPTIVNMAVVIGARFRGWTGAAASVSALILPPAILMTCVGILYELVHTNVILRGALGGVAAAAAGLLGATAVRMASLVWKSRAPDAVIVFIAGFAAIAFARWSLPLVMSVLAPISIALAWRRTSRVRNRA